MAQFEAKEQVRSDIPGLVSRANRPLEFLGLYNTAHSACRRHDIPARHVRPFTFTLNFNFYKVLNLIYFPDFR